MSAMYGGPVLTPDMFATLQSTLGPSMVLTQMEAERVRTAKELEDRAAAARQVAESAGQAYQTAAAAPPPQVAPNEEFINSLTGGIASVLQGNQAPAERANQRTRETRQSLLQARAENLQALRDGWKVKADLAEKAGDLEATLAARSKYEQLSKTFDLLKQQQDHAQGLAGQKELEDLRHRNRMAEDKAAEEERRKTVLANTGMRTGATGEGGAAEWAVLVDSGQANLTTVPYRLRTAVVKELSSKGSTILPTKVRDTVNNLSAARGILTEIKQLADVVNTASGVKRFKQGIQSNIKGMQQGEENVDHALYDKTRQGFLATISRATGERGVLTDRDVLRASNLLPSRFDDKATAQRKVKQMGEFLDEMEIRTIRVYTTPGGQALSEGGEPVVRPTAASADATRPDPLGIR